MLGDKWRGPGCVNVSAMTHVCSQLACGLAFPEMRLGRRLLVGLSMLGVSRENRRNGSHVQSSKALIFSSYYHYSI